MYKLKNIFTGEERYVGDEEVSSFDKRTWKMLAFAEDAIAIEMQILLANSLPRAINVQQLVSARNTKKELREALTEPCTRCPVSFLGMM